MFFNLTPFSSFISFFSLKALIALILFLISPIYVCFGRSNFFDLESSHWLVGSGGARSYGYGPLPLISWMSHILTFQMTF